MVALDVCHLDVRGVLFSVTTSNKPNPKKEYRCRSYECMLSFFKWFNGNISKATMCIYIFLKQQNNMSQCICFVL